MSANPTGGWRTEFARWRTENRALTFAIGFHLALLLFAVLAQPFDHRRILGLNPWVKPIKFDLSTIVYLVTVAALLSGLAAFARSRKLIGIGIALSMILENTIISGQSLRGVRSHMNYTSVADAIAFAVMGLFIALNTLLLASIFALWCSSIHRWPGTVAWGVRLGLLAILAGSFEGVMMVQHGAHTIGAPDGLPGLPFLNWSTAHGDLRVPHFFALHALQAMPLLGLLLARLRWPQPAQITALLALFAGYMGLVWLLFRQALAGRPLLG